MAGVSPGKWVELMQECGKSGIMVGYTNLNREILVRFKQGEDTLLVPPESPELYPNSMREYVDDVVIEGMAFGRTFTPKAK